MDKRENEADEDTNDTNIEDDDNSESSVESDDTTEIRLMEENELRKFKEETFDQLKAISDKFHDTDAYSKEFASDRKDMIDAFQYISSLHSELDDKTTLQNCVQFRKDVAQWFIDSNLLNIISKLVNELPIDANYSSTSDEENQFLRMATNVLLNFTDESDTLANALAKTDVMESCKTILQVHSQLYVEDNLTDFTNCIVYRCTGVVHNVSLRNVNIERLRNLNFIEVLNPFLKPSDENISLVALTTLANIVNEEECSIIESHVLLVARLLWILQRCITTKDRRFLGWSCMELGHAVRNLARNDSNKTLLWNLNALQILIEMATTGNDEEILESVHAIWALLFDEEIRKNITSSQQDLLLKLLDQSVDSKIRNLITKMLWTLREELEASPKDAYRRSISKIPTVTTHEEGERHIMISYQTSNREVLCRIKEALRQHNCRVWMDVDDMRGSTIQAMAEAVENAAIVLVCYSRNYKESENCRLEAEYTLQCKKPIVPLKMEANYKPDGWLGLMIGSKLYVDFTGIYDFEDMLKKLFNEVKSIQTRSSCSKSSPVKYKPVDETDAVPVGSNKRHENKDISVIDTTRQWNTDDVLAWLRKTNLSGHGLENLTGEEIAYMVTMQMEAPEQLHDCIRNDLQISTLLVKARLVLALRDLCQLMKTSKITS